MMRFSFTVEETRSPLADSRFVATLGDYVLDALCGYGTNPQSAVLNWLEMWGDTLLKEPHGHIAAAERDLRLHKLARPVEASDADKFPNIAAACDELAAMPKEKRDIINAEWEGDE